VVTGVVLRRVEHVAVAALLCRAALLSRAIAAMTAAAVGLLLVSDPLRVVVLVVAVGVVTVTQLVVLSRWPSVVGSPVLVVAVDSAVLLGLLALSRGSLAYFSFAIGSAAIAGVLFGMRALPLWAAQSVQGFAVCAAVLRTSQTPHDIATFVLAFPVIGILVGIGAVVATRTMVDQLSLSVAAIGASQRSAAASERARLARELHDSVAKTLRAISLAALALPTSLRRQPALAERLADIISRGAEAADREARELIEGLRLDIPDQAFDQTLAQMCAAWERSSGIQTRTSIAPVDPPLPVRYELVRIAHEALRNVKQHARATRVSVVLVRDGPVVDLVIRDDGVGFTLPPRLEELQGDGHLGLVGMSERAATLGGRLTVESTPGVGTTVTVRVSLASENRRRRAGGQLTSTARDTPP
jgi:signal transduction histidine kinase